MFILGQKMPHLPHFEHNNNFPQKKRFHRLHVFIKPKLQAKNLKKSNESTLRETCPYSEFFWSVFSRIWTEYGEINTDQKNSEHGHFSGSAILRKWCYRQLDGQTDGQS